MEERVKALEEQLSQEQERRSGLEAALRRALDGVLPKVEALLARHQPPAGAPSQPPSTGRGSSAAASPASGHAPASLHQAAERGDAAAVRRCLVGGAQVDARDAHGNTALLVAAAHGRGDVVDVLLANGSAVNERGFRELRPLHCAAAGGHGTIVARLVAAGADVAARDVVGTTAAALAAQEGHADVVLWLLDQGTSVEEADEDGNTLLMYAVGGIDAHVGQPSNVDDKGETALRTAMKMQRRLIVQYLLQNGASPTKTNNANESPLLLGSRNGYGDLVAEMLKMTSPGDVEHLKCCLNVAGSATVVWCFVSEKPDLVLGRAGQQALVEAVRGGRLEVVQTLLAAGAEANGEALRVAAWRGCRDCVVALLDAGADVNARDISSYYCYTALHFAAIKGHADCVKELLQRGADKQLLTTDRRTPYNIAVHYKNTTCIEILKP